MAGIALEDVRGVAFRLRPARLRETGLVAGLRELALSAGRSVEFSADPSLLRPNLLDEEQEVDTYRIVQEALGNATRHAQPDRVRITVQRVDRVLRIEVVDDGVGFDPAIITRRGLGLASMRDRASVLRGTLRLHSRPGMGTVVRLDVPLGPDALRALQGEPAGLAPAGLPIPR